MTTIFLIIATVIVIMMYIALTHLIIGVIKDFKEDRKEKKRKKEYEIWKKNWEKEHLNK